MKQKHYYNSLCARLMTLLVLALLSISNAWGKDYTELFTIKSSDVVSNSGYNTYTKGVDEELYNTAWIITFGGNNKSVGTNEKNRSKCTLSSNSKYAVSPVTTSDIASAFVSTAPISDIAKISYTINGGSNQTNTDVYLIYSSDGNAFSQISLTSGTQGATISSGTAYEFTKCSGFFGLLFKATNTSGNWRIDDVNITFYKEDSAPAAVATPTITSAETDFMESASVSITCDTEGASIYYTLDGTDPTKSSTLYTEPFNITETTTVKAIAYKDSEASEVATKTYTKVTPLTTMDAIFEASSTSGNYWITFNNWVVSGVKGSNAYITDNNGNGLILYKSSHGFAAGDVLSGTVKCALTKYNGSAEITDLTSTTTGLTVTKEGTLNTIEKTIDALAGVNTGAYVNLGVLTYNGKSFVDASKNEIKPYNTFITLPSLTNGTKYNVKGIYIQYNTTKEIAPLAETDFEEVATTKYKIEIDELQNGTISASLDEAAEGVEITLTIEPAEHYRMQSNSLIVLDSETQNVPVKDNKFTMPASDVLVSAEFEQIPTHVAKFFVNDEQYGESQTLEEGAAVVFPENPTDISGKTFVGWTASAIEGVTQEAPEFVTSATIETADLNYYAVFANAEGGAGNYEKVTSALTDWRGKYLVAYSDEVFMDGSLQGGTNGVGKAQTHVDPEEALSENTVTADWGDKHYVEIEAIDETNLSNGYVIKTHSTTTPYFYQTTNSNGMACTATKSTAANYPITITFNDENDIDIALGGAAYGAILHYNNNTGSSGEMFRFYKNGSQNNIYLYKKQEATYSNYCTTVPLRTYNVTISSTGFSTGFAPFDAKVTGATAYQVTVENVNEDVVATLVELSNVIPANTGVILQGTPEATATFTEAVGGTKENVDNNRLVPAIEEFTFKEEGVYGKVFYLGINENGNAAFKKLSKEGRIAAGKAYLMLDEPLKQGAKLEVVLPDVPTGIEVINNAMPTEGVIYNIQGMRTNNMVKGNIYIVNGKKYLVK